MVKVLSWEREHLFFMSRKLPVCAVMAQGAPLSRSAMGI